ncbi:5'-methylthioadenosine/adenosylhomocysteine nucleosidase [Noviherbaspirillum soli]|uniref:5'-methylthioadenosine/adenosylhomocysteine nucleosidase n=1 Tax=Noviherbaspirillum soli TaxID=1064518 RepID=UPI00188D23F7|nr:5'-methylthioadenosine/adenosylhomocysteine nucleosidase [Noviherbaspirillum soli]
MEKKSYRFGIISALQEEQAGLITQMLNAKTVTLGKRDYVQGNLWGVDCVCVLSRLGKVASSATAAMLIERFEVSHLLFTGVAGSADPEVRVGDIVIASELVQHDMDTRPLFPRFEIPLTGLSRFPSDTGINRYLLEAASSFLEQDLLTEISEESRLDFNLQQPRIHQGLIASGDEFIASVARLQELKVDFPDLLAVEMEGAAVAQVCHEFDVPFSVIRTISDNANEDSAVDFLSFIRHVASVYAFHTMRRLCALLP